MFGFAPMLNWAKNTLGYHCVLPLLVATLLLGAQCETSLGDTVIWSGEIDNTWADNDSELINWSGTYFHNGDSVIFNGRDNDEDFIDIVDSEVIVADMLVAGNLDWTFNGGKITAETAGMLVVEMAGNSVLTFENDVDFSAGGVLVESGMLQIGNGGSTGNLSGNIVNNSLVVFNRSDDDLVLNGNITGTGSVVQWGTGTTKLTGNNNYFGDTQVLRGTLRVSSLIGTSSLDVTNGATFGGVDDSSSNVIVAGDVRNSGRIAGISNLTVAGTLNNNVSGNIDAIKGLTASYVNNLGTMRNITDMTAAIIIDNNGLMVDIDSMTAGSIINAGYLVNTAYIKADYIANQNGGWLISKETRIVGSLDNQGGTIAVGNVSIGSDTYGNPVPIFNGLGLLEIGGDFSSAAGTFIIGIDGEHCSHIDVLGTAVINGGTVNVAGHNSYRLDDGQGEAYKYHFLQTANKGNLTVYHELTAGMIDDPLIKPVVGHDDRSYWLSFVRAFMYAGEGKTMNQREMGRYLDKVGIFSDGDYRKVLMALDNARYGAATEAFVAGESSLAPVEDPILKALDQMSGAVFGTATTASVQNTAMFHNTLANVLRRDYNSIDAINQLYRGQAPPNDGGRVRPPTGNLWGMLYGNAGMMHSDGNARAYRQGFYGMLSGFDRINEKHVRLGFFLSMGEGSLSSELRDQALSKEVMAGHFYRREIGNTYVLVQAGLGTHRYDTRRNISFGYFDPENPEDSHFINRTAKSRYNAFLATAHFETGLRYRGGVLNLSPFMGLQYTGLLREGVTERGAESLNLTTDSQVYHTARVTFGTRFDSRVFRFQQGLGSFYGNVAWMYEFEPAGKRHTQLTARFSNAGVLDGPKFKIHGNDPGRDWVQTGFGFNYDMTQNLRTFIGYDAFANTNQVMHSVNLGFIHQR